jgi:dienelactone hydrolase
VLVMHELPGLTKETIAFADRLIAANYRVFLPLLFGEPMVDAAISNYEKLCVMEEFGRLAGGVTAPISDWLRALAIDISGWCNDGRIGAVGMCLTGGFVIPLMLEPTVGAPVTSQPAIPIPRVPARVPIFPSEKLRKQINVSPADLNQAADAANRRDLTLVGFRFTSDWKCPRERFRLLKDTFGSRFECHEYETPSKQYDLGSGAHSVLTYEYPNENQDDNHPSHVAMRRVLSFFGTALAGRPAEAVSSSCASAVGVVAPETRSRDAANEASTDVDNGLSSDDGLPSP